MLVVPDLDYTLEPGMLLPIPVTRPLQTNGIWVSVGGTQASRFLKLLRWLWGATKVENQEFTVSWGRRQPVILHRVRVLPKAV